jgi:hypothetical protein
MSKHPQRREVQTQDVECRLVLVADCTRLVEIGVERIHWIVVLGHKLQSQVGVCKFLHLEEGVIQIEALELFGTQLCAGAVDLMP